MPRTPDPTTRQRILDSATRLFDTYGVHAVGLQQIIDDLGCGKNVLYREFATKDALVAAYLTRCREEWTAMIAAATDPLAGDPAAQLVAIVRTTVEHALAPGYRGCPVHNAHAEFPDTTHPAHPVARDHFEAVQDLLLALATRAGAAEPQVLADRLALIVDGANTNGAALGARGAAAAAVSFAEDVVSAACRRPRRRPAGSPREG